MDYIEFQEENRRLGNILDYEIMIYKYCLMYLFYRLNIKDVDNPLVNYLVDFFNDLIDDATKEEEIIKLISKLIKAKALELTPFFIEDTEEYNLYIKFMRRINNSSVRRLNYSLPELTRLINLCKAHILTEKNCKTVKRVKYITNAEYSSYLSVLKK